jgi:hypothetical protein
MTIVLHEQSERECPSGLPEGDALWLSPTDLMAVTGWQIKPEGLCRDEICVPVPAGRAAEFTRDGAINAAAFWRHMGHPVAHDDAGDVWVLGTGASDRGAALRSLEAPDFALPDLAGNVGSLSEHRGKKVLLATWASW